MFTVFLHDPDTQRHSDVHTTLSQRSGYVWTLKRRCVSTEDARAIILGRPGASLFAVLLHTHTARGLNHSKQITYTLSENQEKIKKPKKSKRSHTDFFESFYPSHQLNSRKKQLINYKKKLLLFVYLVL